MNIGGVRFGAPDAAAAERALVAARLQSPNYPFVGATIDAGELPPGTYIESRIVGHREDDFARARVGLQRWTPQRGLGATIVPDDPVRVGGTVVLIIRPGPFHILVPDRVVAVVDEPRRYAYAYGTLPGHPEIGEEAFVLELLDDSSVRLTIRVAATPATRVGRVVAPIVRVLQRGALRRYLDAVADHVAEAPHPHRSPPTDTTEASP
jgi:uncharacterized protein (UPF0548 family)